MPRGRHRHSPPLHRMLPPSAIAGVSLVCALGPWVFTQPMTLRLLAAAAAAVAILGAVVMRHWDAQAGKQVADLTRARASDEWRFEERVAELESDLEESRELRLKLEHRLRAKRSELAGLRNEHATLLRRYAAAETDRATVLEERRVLEIEAAVPARALTAGPSAPESGAVPDDEATVPAARTEGATAGGPEEGTTAPESEAPADGGEEAGRPAAPRVFSPAGSTLFLRADAALARLAAHGEGDERPARDVTGAADAADAADAAGATDTTGTTGTTDVTDAEAAETTAADAPTDAGTSQGDHSARGGASVSAREDTRPGNPAGSPRSGGTPEDDGPEPPRARKPQQPREDGAEGQPRAIAEHGRATASSGSDGSDGSDTGTPPEQPAQSAQPALPAPPPLPGSSVRRPPGHFTVPTAVAVAPPTEPVRRPVSDGTFDFFGTQNEAEAAEEEAPARHRAEAEPEFGPAEDARGVGQVIDLTAHDEPEPADKKAEAETGTKGLRSAVS
ncbi:hypothetical protein [Streptomyces hirsutus]|uniref:hypothetical protein n=1 Tax=Streptomyces hirsutus TaxID=35620 RepID=UPI0033182538